jgi:hypothetical protein
MSMDIGELTVSLVVNLLSSIIYDTSKLGSVPYFQRRRILKKVEDTTADAIEPLIPFLENEGISFDKQRRLVQVCMYQ